MSSLSTAFKRLSLVNRSSDLESLRSMMITCSHWQGVQLGVVRGLENAPKGSKFLNQTHSTTVHWVSDKNDAVLDGDAMLSQSSGTVCAVKTADCLPLLLWDPLKKTSGACHAGWRGLVANIVQKWVIQAGAHKASSVLIGPCISQSEFEVGSEVIEMFLDQFELETTLKGLCVSRGNKNKWHLDLQSAAALQLIASGILPERIYVLNSCTKSNPGLWESYRRDGKQCGSNVTWIQALV